MNKKYSSDESGFVRVDGGPVARSFLSALFGELKGKQMRLSIDKYGSVTADVADPEKKSAAQKSSNTAKPAEINKEVADG